jgi:hypothetical protein
MREDAGHHALKGLRGARDAGDLALEARGLMMTGLLSADRGELNEARELFRVCEGRAEAASNRMTQFWALNNQLYIAVEEAEDIAAQGELAALRLKLEEAQQLVERAMSAARSSGNPRHEAYVLGNLATLSIVEGDFARAAQSLTAYGTLARDLGDNRLLAYATLDEASLLRAQGRLDEAIEALNADHFRGELGGNVSIDSNRIGLSTKPVPCGKPSWSLSPFWTSTISSRSTIGSATTTATACRPCCPNRRWPCCGAETASIAWAAKRSSWCCQTARRGAVWPPVNGCARAWKRWTGRLSRKV